MSDSNAAEKDWVEWHRPYDDPESSLHQRLWVVQRHIRTALDELPAGPLRAVSLCAGQGRDLIGALAEHRDDETLWLAWWSVNPET